MTHSGFLHARNYPQCVVIVVAQIFQIITIVPEGNSFLRHAPFPKMTSGVFLLQDRQEMASPATPSYSKVGYRFRHNELQQFTPVQTHCQQSNAQFSSSSVILPHAQQKLIFHRVTGAWRRSIVFYFISTCVCSKFE